MPRAGSRTSEPGSVGDELRRLRLDKKWSLGDLHQAVECSISVPYLSRIELGDALPRPEKLGAMATVLEGDLDALLRQRDKEELVRRGAEPEIAELALTLRELDNGRCRALVGELAATFRGMTERSRDDVLRTLTEVMEQLQGNEAAWERGRELTRSR